MLNTKNTISSLKPQPVAIIDIGSNSVRLVIYEDMVRTPDILFNEKILGELGKGLEKTGCLLDSSMQLVFRALKRFRMLIEQSNVVAVYAFATSAVRDAKNGEDFVQEAEAILQSKIEVLSGSKEAYYSGLGVLSGFYKPNGLVGDFGGGSLEIIKVAGSSLGKGVTFPIGGLRLKERAANRLSVAREIVQTAFNDSNFFAGLDLKKIDNFYAIGGVWRSLAKLYMSSNGYPLHIMHNFSIKLQPARRFLQRVARGDVDHLRGIEHIDKHRRYLLSYGAIVLLALLNVIEPKRLVFSIRGVRDGYLYSLLKPKERKKDPLLVFAKEMAARHARSLKHSYELMSWTKTALQCLQIPENNRQQRCREAVCLLADIGWRASEDYRGTQAFDMIAYGAYFGVDHSERLFIALSVYFRKSVRFSEAHVIELAPLLQSDLHKRAKILGSLLDLATLLSGFNPSIIPHISWKKEKDAIALVVPKAYTRLIGDRLEKRLAKLKELLTINIYFKITNE